MAKRDQPGTAKPLIRLALSARPIAVGLLLLATAACNDDGDMSSLGRLRQQNAPPAISGSPKTLVRVGENYQFVPRVSDPDDESLRFEISNRPSWSRFDTSTGRLSGTPNSGDVGSTDGVRISVTDGKTLKSLRPFTIRVDSPSTPGSPTPPPPPPPAPAGSDELMNVLTTIPSGSWVKVNRNRFDEVWTPKAQRATYNNVQVGDPRKIITAWGSLAWDANRRQVIIWGGGHADYAGNDVYRFDVRRLRWERAALPSAVVKPFDDQQFFTTDGALNAPISSHTYDNLEFLPVLDRFITFGGASYNAGKYFTRDDGITPTGPYLWDPSRAGPDMVGGKTGSQVNPAAFPEVIGAEMWQNRDTMTSQGIGTRRPGSFVNGTSAYVFEDDVESLLVSASPATGGDLFRYRISSLNDPARDEWQLVGVGSRSYADQGAGAYDPRSRLYLRTARFGGAYGIVMWNTTTPGPSNQPIRFTPRDANGSPVITNRHGMDFDPIRRVFVLWDGGDVVWYLSPPAEGPKFSQDGWTMTRALQIGPGRPDLHMLTGILGKWKYIAGYDVMLGVGDGNEGQVWVYKPADWEPST